MWSLVMYCNYFKIHSHIRLMRKLCHHKNGLTLTQDHLSMHWFCYILQVTLHHCTTARAEGSHEHTSPLSVVQSVLEWLVSHNLFYRNITMYKRFVVAVYHYHHGHSPCKCIWIIITSYSAIKSKIVHTHLSNLPI